MTYTPYSATDSTGSTTQRLSYSDFSGEGISTLPSYLYYIAMGTNTRALPGYIFTSRSEARVARRTLSMDNPAASFKMYRVPVGTNFSRTS